MGLPAVPAVMQAANSIELIKMASSKHGKSDVMSPPYMSSPMKVQQLMPSPPEKKKQRVKVDVKKRSSYRNLKGDVNSGSSGLQPFIGSSNSAIAYNGGFVSSQGKG